MTFFEDFARLYFEEAKRDFERALKLLEWSDYTAAIFFLQQCVEKCVKALLEAKREYVYNHGLRLASIFVRTFQDEWCPELEEILDLLQRLYEYYTRSRYPFILHGRVVSPREYVTRDVVEQYVPRVRRVIEFVEAYLKRRGILQN